MVYYQRNHQRKKGTEEDEECSQSFLMEYCANSGHYYKRTKPKLLTLLLLSLLSCALILGPHLICSNTAFPPLHSEPEVENEGLSFAADHIDIVSDALSSSTSNGTICCDRSSFRSDICTMKGDVRTNSASSSIFIYSSKNHVSSIIKENEEGENQEVVQHEKIKPYTRKWETSVMDTIDELDLIEIKDTQSIHHDCDVQHDVPAVFFSTGGYTGNVYHEFNDGILPLFITSQHFNKKVVFVILEFKNWWLMKYADILSHLTDYPIIDFSKDKRSHCFPEAIVGLRIHNELTVESSLMEGNKSIVDFRNLLDQAYLLRITGLIREEERKTQEKLYSLSTVTSKSSLKMKKNMSSHQSTKKPKLVIISRNGSRALTNENLLVRMAEKIGFWVEVLRPNSRTELARIYWAMNSSDVMIGVHGAAMTHFLFMKPGSVFVQVIPLGTTWASETYYGEPARKLGLKYIGYQILTKESSLYDKYDKDDPVLKDPMSVANKGWEYTKKIYLEGQIVTLNLRRFRRRLVAAYDYSISRMNQQSSSS